MDAFAALYVKIFFKKSQNWPRKESLIIWSSKVLESVSRCKSETFTFDLADLDPSAAGGANLLKELSVLDTCVTVVDCSNFFTYFKS